MPEGASVREVFERHPHKLGGGAVRKIRVLRHQRDPPARSLQFIQDAGMICKIFRSRLINQTAFLPKAEPAANIIPVFHLRSERSQEALREAAGHVKRLGRRGG